MGFSVIRIKRPATQNVVVIAIRLPFGPSVPYAKVVHEFMWNNFRFEEREIATARVFESLNLSSRRSAPSYTTTGHALPIQFEVVILMVVAQVVGFFPAAVGHFIKITVCDFYKPRDDGRGLQGNLSVALMVNILGKFCEYVVDFGVWQPTGIVNSLAIVANQKNTFLSVSIRQVVRV